MRPYIASSLPLCVCNCTLFWQRRHDKFIIFWNKDPRMRNGAQLRALSAGRPRRVLLMCAVGANSTPVTWKCHMHVKLTFTDKVSNYPGKQKPQLPSPNPQRQAQILGRQWTRVHARGMNNVVSLLSISLKKTKILFQKTRSFVSLSSKSKRHHPWFWLFGDFWLCCHFCVVGDACGFGRRALSLLGFSCSKCSMCQVFCFFFCKEKGTTHGNTLSVGSC